MNNVIFAVIAFCVLLTIGVSAKADQFKTFGEYVVHYNALRSDVLTPEVAKSYSITRRNNKVLININVHDIVDKPAKATVTGYAVNLSSQVKNLDFKEVLDGNSIYYLAQTQVSNGENLHFYIKVKPANKSYTGLINFKQIFYTD